ncbi:hypothetical protein [Luteipulveratus halotolerans]|uniref:Uncharacterized protein n=1 Tax=Luteipulveratus halotolerans TaxID=1631356 RepID=A0A0L6CK43_9MICO|nr:hypothetical protein [Luteipulveratus halotolerans]KNX38104.1 hypothetical protein VV01_14670 [Luteipulveratus halotolerans]
MAAAKKAADVQDPAAFDFEAFLNGFEVDEETVTVFQINRTKEFTEAQAEADAALTWARIAEAEGDDDAQKKHAAEARKHANRAKRLRDEMDASAVKFRIRAIDPDTWREFVNRSMANKSLDLRHEQLAVQVVEPKLTADQWREFGKRIGAGRFLDIYTAALDLTERSVVLPDFSPSTSEVLGRKGSSQS